jgi:Tfp pilus assembly protein PilF
MKKLNFHKAYEILKLAISQGLYHSDIFYLYGEICRIIKKPEESENYLLESLKFQQHSPYVFYSLGLLYQEIEEYKYAICFFKHFLLEINSAEAFYEMAKTYTYLKKDLKAAINLTNAISLDRSKKEYYLLRREIYEKMGYKELASEDKEMINKLNLK